MATDIEREIRRFGRRVRLGRFLGGAAQALTASALVLASALLVLRLLGGPLLFSGPEALLAPAHALLVGGLVLLVPALFWGLRAAARTGFSRRTSAAHLDRRLGLDGLLITSLERDTERYRGALFARLDEARAALPRIQPRPLVLRVGVGLLVLLGVLLLPAPPRGADAANPLGAEALAEFEARLEALDEEEALDADVREELSERLQAMKDGFERDGEMNWTDLDALERRMQNEESLQRARLAQSLQDLEAFARGEDAKMQAGEMTAGERMNQLLRAAAQAGLLDKLPAGLRERLAGAGAQGAGSGLDASALDASGLDEETLKQLAAALAQSAGDSLEGLEAGDLLEGVDLAELSEILDGEACKLCQGEPEEGCPG